MNFIWSNIFAKLMFVKFFPPIDKFAVLHAPGLRPFKKRKNQNQTDCELLH